MLSLSVMAFPITEMVICRSKKKTKKLLQSGRKWKMEESYCWWSITRHNPYPVLEGVEQQLSGGRSFVFLAWPPSTCCRCSEYFKDQPGRGLNGLFPILPFFYTLSAGDCLTGSLLTKHGGQWSHNSFAVCLLSLQAFQASTLYTEAVFCCLSLLPFYLEIVARMSWNTAIPLPREDEACPNLMHI